ncbi:hypothetical protein Droror1_Dr00025357 [Drosera rotundifolia]
MSEPLRLHCFAGIDIRTVIAKIYNSSMAGGRGGHGRRGQALNEEAPNLDPAVYEVIVTDLQKQVAELTRLLKEARYC